MTELQEQVISSGIRPDNGNLIVTVLLEGEIFTIETIDEGDHLSLRPGEGLQPVLNRVYENQDPSEKDLLIADQADSMMAAISHGEIPLDKKLILDLSSISLPHDKCKFNKDGTFEAYEYEVSDYKYGDPDVWITTFLVKNVEGLLSELLRATIAKDTGTNVQEWLDSRNIEYTTSRVEMGTL